MTSAPTWEDMSALGGTRTPNLLIRSSMFWASVPVQISPGPQSRPYPLFMPVRNPRRSFAPVAPSAAPSGTPRGHN